ncbi:MAG: HEAT repeat domain-containing protein [Promethearchaeota archaeon]|nr:MAG: HEAT repeat domain-containing protein [Candidatus Lokiarchaeota archaeon]
MNSEENEEANQKALESLKREYSLKSHSIDKIELIQLIAERFPNQGNSFLVDQYKTEKDWKVRREIIKAVAKGNISEAVPFFIEALNDSNLKSKKTAIKLLGEAGAAKALNPLINLLQYGKVDYYDVLMDSLVKISKGLELAEITKFLDERSIYIKRAIPIILGKLGDKNAEKTLKKLIKDDIPEIRRNAVIALEKLIDEPEEINIILEALYDPDLEVRKEAAKVLGKLGDERPFTP